MVMEVPVINRIRDFHVGINSLLSRPLTAVSGVGMLHHVSSFLKWGALLLLAFLVSLTTSTLVTRIKSLVLRLRNVDVSLPSPTLLYNYDSDTDSSCSSDSSASDDEEEDYDDDKEDDSVNDDSRVVGSGYELNDDDESINGNIPWIRRCNGSFSDLLSSWPDLGGLGSSGVVKLWDHLDDIKGEGSNVASFFGKYGVSSSLLPSVFIAAEKKRSDAVEVSAWDAREGFRMPALLAEWRQPRRLFGKIVRVGVDGDGNKIYVEDDLDGDITVGDMRMVNGALAELTESELQ